MDYGTTTATPDGIEVASGRQQLNAWYTSEGFESQKLNANLTAVNDMIYNSVTKDDEYVYIKLVNVDGYSKTTGINIDNLAMSGKGTMTVLAGTEDNVNTANVNTDGNEVIAPVESEITFQKRFHHPHPARLQPDCAEAGNQRRQFGPDHGRQPGGFQQSDH